VNVAASWRIQRSLRPTYLLMAKILDDAASTKIRITAKILLFLFWAMITILKNSTTSVHNFFSYPEYERRRPAVKVRC